MSHLRYLTVLALVAGLALTTAPAHAGRQTTTDAAHDVFRATAGGQPHLQRDNKVHDIVRAGAGYRGRTLTLWLEVRRLAPADYIATWDVKTPHARWTLHRDRLFGANYTSLFHFHGGEVFDCDGLRSRAVPRRDRVVLTVPRACIGSPRWIRFGASMGRENETGSYHLIDDARLDAGFFSNKCKLGPQVRHN